MRAIKFRGLCKDNLERGFFVWEYGYLNKDTEGNYLIETIDDSYSRSVLVAEETIGQYTGLTDKNGKEIYEGDVIESFNREDFRAQILYREPSFCIKWFDGTIRSALQSRYGTEPIPHNVYVTSEVISNIYEQKHNI